MDRGGVTGRRRDAQLHRCVLVPRMIPKTRCFFLAAPCTGMDTDGFPAGPSSIDGSLCVVLATGAVAVGREQDKKARPAGTGPRRIGDTSAWAYLTMPTRRARVHV
nr:unnamed protein product [Digitaria exilis]